MITLAFIVLMILVFGNILGLAIRLAWGILKIAMVIIFLPVILIGMILGGMIYLAFICLVIIGVISLIGRILA